MEYRRLKTLLIEDDEDDYILVKALLADISETGYELDWMRSYDTGLEALGSRRYDICLLDYRLGERDGLELLHEASLRGFHTPIIFLTGMGNYQLDLDAMRAGAADYLIKGQIEASLLDRSIRYAVERRRAEEAVRNSELHFRRLVETMNEGLAEFDENGCFTYVNDRLCGMLGYSREEMLGKPVAAFHDPVEGSWGGLGLGGSREIDFLSRNGGV
ncbi:MAG: response regulator, partial [Acidobacteriota bacterium]